VIIRTATPEDAESLLAIYAPYVERSAITFEYDVPSADDFRNRIEHTLERFPYLVAEEEGRPLGYAYAGRFQPREALRLGRGDLHSTSTEKRADAASAPSCTPRSRGRVAR